MGAVGLTAMTGKPDAANSRAAFSARNLERLYVPGHVFQGDGLVLVALAACGNADAADRAGIDDALDSGLAGGLQQIARAVDVRAVQFVGIGRPEPVVGGDVKDQSAAGDGARERGGIAQVAGDRLRHPVRAACWRDGPARAPCARGRQEPRDMPADESRSAGDERRFHDCEAAIPAAAAFQAVSSERPKARARRPQPGMAGPH